MILQLPSFKILILLLLAVLLGRYSRFSFLMNWEFLFGIIAIGLAWFSLYSKCYSKKKWLYQFFLIAGIFLLFLSYYHYRVDLKTSNDLSRFKGEVTAVYGKVISYPFIRTKKTKWVHCNEISLKKPVTRQEYFLEAKELRVKEGDIAYVSGKILVRSRAIKNDLKKGDWVIIETKAYPVIDIKPCPQFDYKQYLTDREIYYILYPWQNANIKIIKSDDSNIIEKGALFVHDFLFKLYTDNLPEVEGSLIKGLILGEREGISEDIIKDFQKTGVIHILAVSGLHVGMIALFFYVCFSLFRLPKEYILVLVSLTLIFYVFVTGERLSVLRATIMFICGALVIILDRDRLYLNALFLAAIIILIYNPLSLFYLSFQLSFLATLGILLYFKRISAKLLDIMKYQKLIHLEKGGWSGWIRKGFALVYKKIIELFSLTLSAQLLIVPILIFHFHGISIVSLFSNVIIVIITQLSVALGLFLPFVSFSGFLTDVFSSSLTLLLRGILYTSNFISNISFSYIDNIKINYLEISVYYLLILVMFHFNSIRLFFQSKVKVGKTCSGSK